MLVGCGAYSKRSDDAGAEAGQADAESPRDAGRDAAHDAAADAARCERFDASAPPEPDLALDAGAFCDAVPPFVCPDEAPYCCKVYGHDGPLVCSPRTESPPCVEHPRPGHYREGCWPEDPPCPCEMPYCCTGSFSVCSDRPLKGVWKCTLSAGS